MMYDIDVTITVEGTDVETVENELIEVLEQADLDFTITAVVDKNGLLLV